MKFLKNHIIKSSLVVLIIVLGVFSIYSVNKYYKTSSNQNNAMEKADEKNPSSMQKNEMKPSGGKQANPPKNPDFKSKEDNKGGIMKPGDENNKFQGTFNLKASSNSYLQMKLTAYLFLFLSIILSTYYCFYYKKIKISKKNEKFILIYLLMLGFLIRIILTTFMNGYDGDINLFKNWASWASKSFSNFYSGAKSSDYPPLYIYVLYLVGKLSSIASLNRFYVLFLKLPSILADIISSLLIYKISKKYLSTEISIFLCAFYIFSPAVFINSAIWGQVDSFFTLIIIAFLYFLAEKKLCLSSVLLTAAVLMKPQGIIFAPVLFFELVRLKKTKNFIKVFFIALAAFLIIILPFSINKNPLWIFNLYKSTVSEYPYASLNAYNFFSLIGANHVKDSNILLLFSYHTYGMIFIVFTTLFSWFIYIKGQNTKYAFASALILITGVFTFSVGMHERYLFPAAALAIISYIYLKDKRLLLSALGFSLTTYLNTYFVLFNSSTNAFMILISISNILLLFYTAKIFYDNACKKKCLL